MDYLDYGSGAEEDDCYVDDVDYEQDKEDYQNPDLLNSVSDLEFIATHAADYNVDFNAENDVVLKISLPASAMEEDDSSSEEESGSESEGDERVVQTGGVNAAVSSSDSSDSSDSEDEVITKKAYNKQSKQIHWLTEEEGEEMATGPLKTRNEIDEVVEPLDHSHIEIRDTADLTTIGEVMYRIDHECVVVIQSDYTTSPLNEGSIICNIDGKVLGKVQEIFGPITTPFYTVRWKNVATAAGNNNKNKGGGQNKKQNNKQKGKKVAGEGAGGDDDAVAVTGAGAADGAVQLVALADDAPVLEETSMAVDTEIELDSSLPAEIITPDEGTAAPAPILASEAGIPEKSSATEPKVSSEQGAPAPKIASGLEISDVRALFPVGARLFTVNSCASFVLPSQLQKAHVKGSDASNAYDEEPPEEDLEYSDDEQEMLAKQARKASKKGTTSGPVSASTEANFGDAIPTGYEKAGFGRGRGKKVPNFGAAGARSAGVPASMVPQPPVYGQYANAVPMQAPYPVQPPHMQMPMQGYPPMQQANAVPMHQAPMQQPMHGHMYGQPYQQQYPSYSNTVQPPPPPPAPVPYMGSYSSTGLQYGMPQVAAPYPPAGYAPSPYAQAPPMPGYTAAPVTSAQAPPVPQYQYMPIQYGAGAPGAPPAGQSNAGPAPRK